MEENNLIHKEKNNYLNDSDSLIKIENNFEMENQNRNKNKSFETIYERNMKFNENKNRKIQNLQRKKLPN